MSVRVRLCVYDSSSVVCVRTLLSLSRWADSRANQPLLLGQAKGSLTHRRPLLMSHTRRWLVAPNTGIEG